MILDAPLVKNVEAFFTLEVDFTLHQPVNKWLKIIVCFEVLKHDFNDPKSSSNASLQSTPLKKTLIITFSDLQQRNQKRKY